MLTTAKTKDIAINNSDPLVRELAIEALLAGIADDGKVELTLGLKAAKEALDVFLPPNNY